MGWGVVLRTCAKCFFSLLLFGARKAWGQWQLLSAGNHSSQYPHHWRRRGGGKGSQFGDGAATCFRVEKFNQVGEFFGVEGR